MRQSETVPYRAGDGFQCNLVHWFDPDVSATEGPIILVHGAGVRANTFNPPNAVNLIDMLVDRGYDVWASNWRASIDLEFNEYDRMQDEFGKVPISFFRHIARCARAGVLISNGKVDGLPERYTDFPPKTDARFSFFTGRHNRTFLWESQQQSFDYFDRLRPGFHSFHLLEGYNHLDVFYGKNAHQDVFPLMIAELDKTSLRAPGGSA